MGPYTHPSIQPLSNSGHSKPDLLVINGKAPNTTLLAGAAGDQSRPSKA